MTINEINIISGVLYSILPSKGTDNRFLRQHKCWLLASFSSMFINLRDKDIYIFLFAYFIKKLWPHVHYELRVLCFFCLQF